METYYPHDAPALGAAVVVVSAVAALDASVGGVLREAARDVREDERLIVGVLWPAAPQDTPVLTTLDERLDYLRQVECALGRSLTALVLPTASGPRGDAPVEAALQACCQPRARFIAPDGDLTDEDGNVETTRAVAKMAAALARGDMDAVTAALGAYYPLTGLVVQGDQRGRLLGFPTANVLLDARKLLPPNGIYAVRVRLPGEERATHLGAASIGVRPTFGAGLEKKVEVFLLDTSLDLYGQVLGVQVVAYLRSEERFESVEALCAQMERDVANTRERLALAPRL